MINSIVTKSIIDFVNSNDITKEKTTQFLADCRSIIESTKKQEIYPTLYFYCIWALHPDIDRNPFVFKVLDEMSCEVTGIGESGTYNISNKLRIYQLIDELIDIIIESFNPNIAELSDKYIENLLFQILRNLSHRKLHFPEQKNKKEEIKYDNVIRRASSIAKTVDESKKSIDKEVDYSQPLIINSISIENVVDNLVSFELTFDDYTHKIRNEEPKNVKIKWPIRISIKLDETGNLRFYSSDLKK